MTQEKIKRIHQCYAWILTALIAAVGVLFILACLGIYTSGPRPYSAASISRGFRQICIPVYITLLGVLGGIVLKLVLPLDKKQSKGPTREDAVLMRLTQKTGTLKGDAEHAVSKEYRLRRWVRISTAALYAAIMCYPTVYILTPAHFTVANLNGDIIRAVCVVMIPAVLGLFLCWVCQILLRASMRREIALRKQALASGQKSTSVCQSKALSARALWFIRSAVLAVAILLIVLGIFNGGVDDVLKKAIAICTECIGLG